MCCGAIYLMGVSRVVYGLSAARLSAMSGFAEDFGARELFALGKRKVEVVGPVLEDEAAAVMAEYLKKRRH
jgi:tRNA(Arg) A34 adenosine deaminase TadA